MKEQPDLSILVKSIEKQKAPNTAQKSVSVYLGEGVNLPTGGGGAIVGEGEPTIKTEGEEGQTYLDTTTGKYYVLTKVKNNTYFWTEIDTETPMTSWGTVWYYTDYTDGFAEEWADGCVINSIDKVKLQSFIDAHRGDDPMFEDRINFDYTEGWDPETGEPTGEHFWMYFSMEGEVLIPQDEMLATTGIDVTLDDPEGYAMFSLMKSLEVNTESEVKSVEILTKAQYDSLGGWDPLWQSIPLGKNGIKVYGMQIQKVQLSDKITYIPDYFLCNCLNCLSVSSETYALVDHQLEINFGGYNGDSENSYQIGNEAFVGCALLYRAMFFTEGHLKIGNSVLIGTGNEVESQQVSDYGIYIHVNSMDCGADFATNSYYYSVYLSGNNSSKIGNNFLSGTVVASDISLTVHGDGIISIGDSFLKGVSAGAIRFASNSGPWKISRLGDRFLSNVSSYQINIFSVFSLVTRVGAGFLLQAEFDFKYGAEEYFRVFVKGLTRIGEGFMGNCTIPRLVGGTLNFGNLMVYSPNEFMMNTGVIQVDLGNLTFDDVTPGGIDYDTFLATDDESNPMYANGVTVFAKRIDNWRATFPNSDGSENPYFRNITWVENGGGGSGTSYIFNDTNDGWEVIGTDGSYFAHTDKGGGFINGFTTPPTSATEGEIGVVYSYVDTIGATPEPHLMVCTAISVDQGTGEEIYTWVDILDNVAQALANLTSGSGV